LEIVGGYVGVLVCPFGVGTLLIDGTPLGKSLAVTLGIPLMEGIPLGI
jgi:hypothetical protein